MAFDVKTDDARCIREASFIEKLFRDEKERFYFLKDKVSLQRFLFSLSLYPAAFIWFYAMLLEITKIKDSRGA